MCRQHPRLVARRRCIDLAQRQGGQSHFEAENRTLDAPRLAGSEQEARQRPRGTLAQVLRPQRESEIVPPRQLVIQPRAACRIAQRDGIGQRQQRVRDQDIDRLEQRGPQVGWLER